VFSGLCSLRYWPGTKTFWVLAVSALCLIRSQWGWKCLERTSSLSQPLAHEEWQRRWEGAPPAFRFVHPSALFPHANQALQLRPSQCSSVCLQCPLKSSSVGLALSPVLRTHIPLQTSKYRNAIPSLDGETHGKFRFILKLITNRYCWTDECMKLGSLQLCILLLDYPLSDVLPLAANFSVWHCRRHRSAAPGLVNPLTLTHPANAAPQLLRVRVCVFISGACLHKGTGLQGQNVFENITSIKLVRKSGSHLEGASTVIT